MVDISNIETPKVSVCIPAYKAPEFFKRVIDSVIAQDYPNFEVIVTDDSPDSCIEDIIISLVVPAPLRYEKNPRQLGAPKNWNRAIGMATGVYIKILHHDDWLLTPHSLSQFVELMRQHPQAGLGFSAAEAYDQEHRLKFVHTPPEDRVNDLKRDCNTLFMGNLIGPPSSIIFKNTPGLRFDEKLRWLVDIDFYIQLLQEGGGFAYCQQPLVGVTVESDHQVTRECENNKQVELYEHLYLFTKLLHKGKHFSAYMRMFSRLFKRFSIRSARELTLLAPDVEIPWYLKLLASATRLI